MKMKPYSSSYRMDRRAGYQGSRPSVRGQAEVEKYATGPHYSKVASFGRPAINKRHEPNNVIKQNIPKSTKNSLWFGTINTQTTKDELKLVQCVMQCKHLKQDISFFQETHMIGHNTIQFQDNELKGWRFIYSGFKKKAQAGVGIALSPGAKIIDIDVIMEGRILFVRTIVKGIRLSALCAYAPTESHSDSSKDLFYFNLNNILKKMKTEHPSFQRVVGCDMNATIGIDSNGKWSCLGENNDNLPTNNNGSRLLDLCSTHQMHIMNSHFETNWTHRHSWYSPTGFTKRIDYILCDSFLKRFSTNCRVYRRASVPFDTDHRLVAMHCSIPCKAIRKMSYANTKNIQRKPLKNMKALVENQNIF